MIDFIVHLFAEIADFFLNIGLDKLFDKFTKKK